VDEGWGGEPNGHTEDGAADGWDCQNGQPDPYTRADRALQRAQADVAEQRDRLEKVRPGTHTCVKMNHCVVAL
jgi:hypothetical protein